MAAVKQFSYESICRFFGDKNFVMAILGRGTLIKYHKGFR